MKSRTIKIFIQYDCLSSTRGRRGNLLPLYSRVGLVLLLVIILQMSCASSTQIIRETSSSGKPEWIETPPRENEMLYFVGIKTSSETQEEGRDAALRNAMSKISDFMGSKIESVFEDYISEVEQKLIQQIRSKSSATVKGAQVVDSYYEKMVRIDKNFRIEKYDVYVLVKFSKAEVTKEINRQQKIEQEKIKTAYDYYLDGLSKEKMHKYPDARRYYKQALTLVGSVEGVLTIDNYDIKNSEELYLRLQSHLQHVNLQLSRVKLFININGSHQANQTFISNFVSALNEHGFTITDKRPAIKIAGKVFVTKSSYVMNNYFYYAEGSVSAQRTFDRQTVASYPFKVKGVHRLKEQAALNALAEAGIEAGNALSKMLLKKEAMKESSR